MAQPKPGRAAANDRQRKALELRKAGLSFAEIAKRVGYASASSARSAVIAALKKASEETGEASRKLELERLNRLLLAIWPKAIAGEPAAVDRALRIMQQRAKLVGLYEPDGHRADQSPKATCDTEQGLADDEDPVAQILAILAEIGSLPARFEALDQTATE